MGKMCLSWRRSQLIMAVERNKNVIFPTRTLLIPIGRLKKFPHSNFYCLGSRCGDDGRVCHGDLLQLSLLSYLNSKLFLISSRNFPFNIAFQQFGQIYGKPNKSFLISIC